MEHTVCTVRAASETYLQQNNLVLNNRSVVRPVAITTGRGGSGWTFDGVAPTVGLLSVVATYINKSISIEEFESDVAPAIGGMAVELPDAAKVFVNRALNFCWRRFIVAKEMTHLLLNCSSHSYRSFDAEELQELVMKIQSNSDGVTQAENSEYLAYVGAIELLIPKEVAEECFPLADGVAAKDLALKLRVPEQIISHRNLKSVRDFFEKTYRAAKYENAILVERSNRAS